MKDNRTVVIRARFSQEEKAQAISRAKAEGVTLSTLLRKSVLCERIVSKTDIQTVFELKKIGANLNQLTKHINTLPVDEEIRLSLLSIDIFLKEIKKTLETIV